MAAAAGTTAKVKFGRYRPTAAGDITWTVTIDDAFAAKNSATAITKVKEKRGEHKRNGNRERDDDDREDERQDHRGEGHDRD